ncbi:DsbC family protein [Caballeronia sp. LZ032]|uniref:DsbC family protein n=1 Tax=Caballeronia sp. LZ032 TaxID=3038565 RepID=UPI002863538C|nr:DsbC family protein [Caballeronia sp. LZ032]MDR5880467.1 DsbC family protein [Caballeronia sp. LZ032]
MKQPTMFASSSRRAVWVICAALCLSSSAVLAEGFASLVRVQDQRVDFSSLPLNNAIKTVQGNGARKLAVFADPYCPFCRKLEQTLSEVKNVTIYTFLFPILTPKSRPMSEALWCAPDADAAWRAWMLEARPPAQTASCTHSPIASNLALAMGLGVHVTPTVVFSDGELMTGALPLDDLNSILDSKPR